jgi:hypothetical protein
MASSNPKTMTPVMAVLSCWILALLLGIYHGPSIGADTDRQLLLGETTEVRSKLPRMLSWLADITGTAGLLDAAQRPAHHLYEVRGTVGEVIAAIETAAPQRVAEPEAPEPAPPSPLIEPKRVLVMGASSIQYELGRALARAYQEREGVEVERFGRHSTGLARPDYFDWPAKAITLAEDFKPDLVIAQYGGNDGQGVTNKQGKGLARFGTDEWHIIYTERVTDLVRSMQERGAAVVILGMPVMKKKRFRQKITRINAVTRAAAEAAGATFIDTVPMTADEKGRYRRRARVDERLRIIRATDGIHMTAHGAVMVSREVIALLEAAGSASGGRGTAHDVRGSAASL